MLFYKDSLFFHIWDKLTSVMTTICKQYSVPSLLSEYSLLQILAIKSMVFLFSLTLSASLLLFWKPALTLCLPTMHLIEMILTHIKYWKTLLQNRFGNKSHLGIPIKQEAMRQLSEKPALLLRDHYSTTNIILQYQVLFINLFCQQICLRTNHVPEKSSRPCHKS